MQDNVCVQSVLLSSPLFPACLKDLSNPPGQLFWRGDFNIDALEAPYRIAIVGTRKVSAHGENLAFSIAHDLARAGVVIISGLALGVDGVAHRGALAGDGITWAVLPCGIKRVYPSQHESIAQEILSKKGCLFSEYPADAPAFPGQFVSRNRIIAALANAVVIVEAPTHSGALHTARAASQLGRKLFVVPGPVGGGMYDGSFSLIRSGATLVTSASDIMHDLSLSFDAPKSPLSKNSQNPILQALATSPHPLSLDMLSQITTLSPHVLSAKLSGFIVEGLVSEDTAGRYFLKNK